MGVEVASPRAAVESQLRLAVLPNESWHDCTRTIAIASGEELFVRAAVPRGQERLGPANDA